MYTSEYQLGFTGSATMNIVAFRKSEGFGLIRRRFCDDPCFPLLAHFRAIILFDERSGYVLTKQKPLEVSYRSGLIQLVS